MGNCYCDFDAPSVYVTTTVKAKKEHKCNECDRKIIKGQSYERTFGVWEGHVHVYKTCQRCTDLRDFVKSHIPCLCWMHGQLYDDCVDAAKDYAREAPGLLFGAYRRYLRTGKENHA